MKKILVILLCLIISLSAVSPAIASANIKVVIDNKQIAFDVPPTEINGRVLVPVRVIFEALGATVDWDDETQTVISRKDETIIVLQIDNNMMMVNETLVTLDVAATEIGGRTLVPVRAISEAFGVKVGWDENTNTVLLSNSVAGNTYADSRPVTGSTNSNKTNSSNKTNVNTVSIDTINQTLDYIKDGDEYYTLALKATTDSYARQYLDEAKSYYRNALKLCENYNDLKKISAYIDGLIYAIEEIKSTFKPVYDGDYMGKLEQTGMRIGLQEGYIKYFDILIDEIEAYISKAYGI